MENKEKIHSVKFNFIKRMIIQILVCSSIYFVFYNVSNNEYIFSKDFRKGLDSLLNTQIDFNQLYNDCNNYFSELLSTNNEKIVEKEGENNSIQENPNNMKEEEELDKNETVQDNSKNMSEIEDINIGGADVRNEEVTGIQANEGNVQEKSQMEIDAQDIKNSISFEVPVNGYISSTFGLRSPTTATVPKNHTGLDIAAVSGTVIRSATDGTVVLASSYGDYGNHYKIQIEDVTIIYAHCKKLYLKEGDIVKQGQEIAEIGSTGNSTGPHLHFEIRKDGRLVDPQLVLDL